MLAAEPPYKEGELRDRYVLTESQLRSSISDIKRLMGIKRQPKGAVFECYESGACEIDSWLSIAVRIYLAPPPGAPTYYRFVYNDGHPVSIYRHEQQKVRLSHSYYYDQWFRPALSVMFNKEGKPSQHSLLTYDNIGRIKRVMKFNAEHKPLFIECFSHSTQPPATEYRLYSIVNGGELVSHTMETADAGYSLKDGQRIKLNNKLRSEFMADFKRHGIRSFYPDPSSP